MTPTRRLRPPRRFRLRPPAPAPRPPKAPRAPGVTLDSLRERIHEPFHESLSRLLGALGNARFEPPAPVFVPPGTVLRDDLGRLPKPGDLPKRSRKEVASDIENTTINIHTTKDRQERETLRARLRDLFRELDELEKP